MPALQERIHSGEALPEFREELWGKRLGGMGLLTLKYRVGTIRGMVEIRTAAFSDTEVICTFPKG